MGHKLFLSFLGITNYTPTNYYYKSFDDKIDKVRFIQEASIRLFCKDWTESDRIVILVTEKSKKSNWFSDGHIDRDTKQRISSEGLKTRLDKLDLKAKTKHIEIPEGNNEKEIWGIFHKIFKNIEPNDKVWFDITHSYRFLPMLNMVLINYTKFLKNINVEKITYGNWEARDGEDNSPIVDITSFSTLQDWTSAANEFINFGNADKLTNLTSEEIGPVLRKTRGSDKVTESLKKINNHLSPFLSDIQTCRGLKIYENHHGYIIFNELENVQDSYIEPLTPILRKIGEFIQQFNKYKDFSNGLFAVKWCIRTGLVQQGFTILQETLVSLVCEEMKMDVHNITHRNIVNSAFKISFKSITREKWTGDSKKHPNLTQKILDNSRYLEILKKEFASLASLRNDINHAGFTKNPIKAEKIPRKLEESLNVILNILF